MTAPLPDARDPRGPDPMPGGLPPRNTPVGRIAALILGITAVAILGAVALRGGNRGTPSDRLPVENVPAGALPPPGQFFWETSEKQESLVPLDDIIPGGPGPDGIPPIDRPRFEDVARVDWLDAQEPVFALEVDGVVRAYPLQILMWHEIVNDTIGGRPVAVTYCPLCNTSIAFERVVRGVTVTFGTSGRLYQSDLVMYDRATRSLWVQFTGQAVVGPLIGEKLDVIAGNIVSWEEFRKASPDAEVLSRDTGFDRPYGRNPYTGYDSDNQPFLFTGDADPRLPAIARVVGVRTGGAAKAYPLQALRDEGDPVVVNDKVGTDDVALFFKRGVRSALDEERIADSRDVGATAVFLRKAGDQSLTFAVKGGRIADDQTGSTWDIFGRATAGALKGKALTPVDKIDTFWFAWSVFLPGADIWAP